MHHHPGTPMPWMRPEWSNCEDGCVQFYASSSSPYSCESGVRVKSKVHKSSLLRRCMICNSNRETRRHNTLSRTLTTHNEHQKTRKCQNRKRHPGKRHRHPATLLRRLLTNARVLNADTPEPLATPRALSTNQNAKTPERRTVTQAPRVRNSGFWFASR